MIALASNLELLRKHVESGTQAEGWYRLWEVVPGAPEPPFPIEDLHDFHRRWLALFDGVPRRDYDTVKERLATVESESENLRNALHELTKAMTGLKDLPEALSPWLELAEVTMRSHMKWLGELSKSWEAAEDKCSADEGAERSG